MNHGSFFSGIGGFDLAAEWMGWNNIFHCEWNQFGQKMLKYYCPNAISYDDITKTDFTIHRGRIDILTGGFPCQPYSMAGKRKGKDDERHLWPEMLRAIREIRPRWVVGENVFGLINWNGGLVFDEVQIDLEAEGYEVFPYVLPACAVDAPHRRDRVWFVAYSNSDGQYDKSTEADNIIRQNHKQSGTQRKCSAKRFSNDRDAPDTGNEGLQGSEVYGSITGIRKKPNQQSAGCIPPTWQDFPTQSPVCGRNDGLPTELDGITLSKWRNESIKAYGNAVVPQVVLQIFKSISYYESIHR